MIHVMAPGYDIDVYSGKVYSIFIFYVKTSFFSQPRLYIAHGFIKK